MCLAVPGKLLSVRGDEPLQRLGRVSFGGVVKEVNLACVPEAKIGDYVIVHVGLALSVVDPDEAERVFEYLREMDELAELGTSAGGTLSTALGAAHPNPPPPDP
jgi:hydrogenase expression/formation protein HypC